MSLLNTENENTEVNTESTENTTENVITENNTTTDTTTEEVKFLDGFKEYMGEDWDDKFENTYNKFDKDGELDANALLKSYRNLEKSYATKNEAPENYEAVYSEDISEDFHFDTEADLVKQFSSTAKDLNLTNDQYNGILNMMAGYSEGDIKAQAEAQEQNITELKQNIPNFQERANKIEGFLQQELKDADEINAISAAVTSEKGMIAIEKLMKNSRDTIIPIPNNTNTETKIDAQAELDALYEERNLISDPHLKQRFHMEKIRPAISRINK